MKATTTRLLAPLAGLVALLLATGTQAQLTVNPQTDLQALAATITGPGVRIANPVIDCHNEGYGEFSYSGSELGIAEGVLLTSGRITETIGPNNVENKTFQQGTSGNALLNEVTGRSTRDACLFEFDIIPSGDSLRFNFVLGSEEYNEWVGSQYNDVFGFFISGPGITGDPGIGSDHNIALVPGTGLPVTINNVNNGSNSAFYFDNAGGQDLQYDGLTRGLYAESMVQPCQTYHLKLVVADASDRKFDSGVFIERIQSNQVVMASQTVNGTPHMVEGCNPGWVTFTRPAALPVPLNLSYYLQGTATNGADYTAIGNVNPNVPKLITIPANQTSATVNVNPPADASFEPNEELLFILGNPFCPAVALDTLHFMLKDTMIATVSPASARICLGDSVQFQVSGGAAFDWSPAASLNSATIRDPWASPSATTTYTLTVNEGTCSRTFTRQVRVSDAQLTATITRPLCSGQSNGALNLTVSGGIAPYSFAWSGPNGSTFSTEDLVNVETGTYTVTVTDGIGCIRSQSFYIGTPAALSGSLLPSIQPFGENIACYGASTGTLNLNVSGGTGPFAVEWTGPNGFSSTSEDLSGIGAGAYNVSIEDANGCSFSTSFTMTEPTEIEPVVDQVTHVACFGVLIGEVEVVVNGGRPAYSYSWNTAPVQNGATATGLAPGTYTVTVTDGYNCTSSTTATVNGPSAALTTTLSSTTAVSCFGGTNGSATVAAAGGTSPYAFSWNTSPVQTNATATNLAAGTWICTVTDANGCSTTRNVIVTQPTAALTTSIGSQINVNCFGANSGAATVVASGGTGPYGYSWNTTPVQTTATATNLSVGTWICTVTDARGCTAAQPVTLTQPAAMLAANIASQTHVSCNGGSTGAATAVATGGTAPYTYQWNTTPVQYTATATNLAAGTYVCSIMDDRDCSISVSVTISQPMAALATSIGTQRQVSCFGGNDGSASINVTGGTAPYTYSWNTTPVQTSATANNLGVGTWTCTVSDANGCTTSRSVIITQPTASLSTSIASQNHVACFGGSTGSATVAAMGGTGPYTYSWNTAPVQNAATANSLPAGTWTCTVTDARGCVATQSVIITQPLAALSASLSGSNMVSCSGGNDATATITAVGGTAPYTYGWNTSPAQNNASANNLPAGTWTCTITDARGCTTAQSVTITQPASALSATIATQSNVNCFGGQNGSATITASGGTGPYSYSWNTTPAQNNASANNLSAGTWTCTITDANGCSFTRNVTITQPTGALSTSISAQNQVGCFGESSGSATVTATGGSGPYTYSWNTSPAQSTATANNLTAGTWTCTVTDAQGCTLAQNVSITQPAAALAANLSSQTNVSCSGNASGRATVIASGGTAPYTHSWNTSPAQNTATAINLLAGTWTCTVTDAAGCTTSRSVTITQPAAALSTTISALGHVACFGTNTGTASIDAQGGTAPYTFNWNTVPGQNAATATGLPAGTWTCAVADANGCTTSQAVLITQPAAALATNIVSQTNASCYGGNTASATIGVSGGTAPYGYAWDTTPAQNAATASSLSAGTWTCTVTDANGCTALRSVTITQPTAALSATLSAQTNVTCFAGNTGHATISAIGGTAPYSYAWNTSPVQNTATATNLLAGTWTCTVTDSRGCVASASVTITQPAAVLNASLTSQTNVNCHGGNTGNATITVTGGTAPYTYGWNTTPTQSAATATNLSAGTWTCTVTDANGCSTLRNVSITQPLAALAMVGNVTPATCGGAANGAVDATVTGGTGPYTITWSGPNGFSSNNTDIGGLASGVYTMAVSDQNGCSTTSTFNVGQPGMFTLSGTTTDHNGYEVSCPTATDGSIAQTITGGTTPYTHAWTGPNGFTANSLDISGLTPGSYTYVLTDDNGCSTSATYTLDAPAPLAASLTSPTTVGGWNIACNGGSTGLVDATISGGVAPIGTQWTGPSGFTASTVDIATLIAGQYDLVLTDLNGCTATSSILLSQAPALVAAGSMIAPVSCNGGNDGAALATVSGGTAPYTHTWNTAPVQSTPGANDLPAGTWTCTITDANACNVLTSVIVPQPAAALSITITGTSDVLCHGALEGSATTLATGGTAPYSYLWNTAPAQLSATATGLPAGSHNVTVTDGRGCTASTTATIDEPATEITASFDQVTHVTCFGAQNGSATIDVSGGSGAYTITWDTQPPTSGPTATGLAPGLYLVAIMDNNGCTHTKAFPVTIQGASAAMTMSVNTEQVSCNGAVDGAMDLTITGGQAPYSHIWTDSNGQQSGLEDLSALGPDSYDLQIIDFFGCELDTTITITEPPVLTTSGVITTAACQGSSTGAVNANVAGGTAPYTFAWSGPNGFTATTEDIGSLAAGIYELLASDANGCALTTNFNVAQPGSLDLAATVSTFNGGWSASCAAANDASIDLEVTGGTAPFTHQWSGPNGFNATSEDIAGLAAGTYTVSVTDDNGCTMTLSRTITAPPTLSASLTPTIQGGANISCAGAQDGGINTTMTGGTAPFSYSWTGPNGYTSTSEDINGLGAGSFTAQITDANGCQTTTIITLVEPNALAATITTSSTPSGHAIACAGTSTGTAQLTINGGSQPWAISWSGPGGFSATTSEIVGLDVGTYAATVTDANGCTHNSQTTLTAPAALEASGIVSDFNGMEVTCAGASDGSINLTVTGGAGSPSFTWTGSNGFGATTEDVGGLEAGTYEVNVTDLNGCTSTASFTLDAPQPFSAITAMSDFNGSGVGCAGGADGSIDLELAGGTLPYTISWTGPNGFTSTNADINGLAAGDYTVAIVDANGCTTGTSNTLNEPAPIQLAVQTSAFGGGHQISCAGGTDGLIDLTVTGGTAPYTVAWSDGIGFTATTEDINGIGAGLYTAIVTDANGCSQPISASLTAPTPLDLNALLSNINGHNVTCDGATDGSIDLTVTGGLQPYSFAWDDGNTDEDRSNITAGTYAVTITDGNGCTINAAYTLTAPASVLVAVTSTLQPGGTNTLCAGGQDGSLEAAISGGTAPYTVAWTGPNAFASTEQLIDSLFAGQYALQVTDANGCMHTSAHVLTEPAPLSVALTSTTYSGGYNIPCSTVSIGVFDATSTGGTPSYTYAWSGPGGFTSTNEDLTSLEAGSYDLVVTDANGCTGSATAVLTAPGPLDVVIQFSDFSGYPVSCAGNDGTLNLNVTGGTPAYLFDWTGPNGFGTQQEDISGLAPGAYTLTVTDANGCSRDTSVTLVAPLPLQASFANQSNSCSDASLGSIDLSLSGGGAPYLLNWSGPNGFSSTADDLSALPNGNYTVIVNDALGCTGSFNTALTGPAPIMSGTYLSFYGQYNLQCQGDSSGVLNLAPVGGTSPFGVLINGPGGFTSSAMQNTGLVAGDYTMVLTDANGCTLDTTVTLTEPSTSVGTNLTLSVYPSGTNVSCYGASDGAIDATITGGTGPYTFSWRGPDSLEFNTEDVTGLPAGDYNYELVVTDANQCNFFTTVTLTQPDTALFASSTTSVFNGANVSCNGANDGAIDLSYGGGNGGYAQSWTGPDGFSSSNEDLTDLVGGTYTATITDMNGCVLQHVVEIIAPQPLVSALSAISFPGGTGISCAGLMDGAIHLALVGGTAPYTQSWTGPNGFTSSADTISGLGIGTYCVQVVDANGCTADSCFTIIGPDPLSAEATATAAACASANGTVDLSVAGGSAPYQFVWDNGATTEDLADLAAGDYAVAVMDANGCTAQALATVVGSNALVADAATNDNNCHGTTDGSIDLTVTSGSTPYSFNWSNGAVSEDLSGLAAGTYSVAVTDAAGCTFTQAYTISEPTAIAMDTVLSSYANGHHISAFGASDGSITTAISGGVQPYVFAWSNGADTESLSGLTAGTYTLTVTDANGCGTTLTVELTGPTDVLMPTAFSPNGDDDNQFFEVRGIEGYPRNQLTVLNRWGNVVYERPNYANEWAGENSQGSPLPNGTYFVILSINDGMRTLQGYVDLRR